MPVPLHNRTAPRKFVKKTFGAQVVSIGVWASNRLDYAGRITRHDNVRRDVFCDSGTGTDYNVVTNRYSGTDRDTAANPYIISYSYWFGPLDSLITLLRLQWMARRVHAYIRADEAKIADSHFRFIKNREVEIGKKSLSDVDILAIVTPEWLVELKILAVTAE